MQLPLQITIRDLPASEAITANIKKKAEKLETYYDNIMSCRVVVDTPQKQKHQGKLYQARIDITVPGHELVFNHNKNEDVYVAIRDAFDAAARELKNLARKQRGSIKTHPIPLHGRISRLFTNEGYGFIETVDKQEYYFSTSNLAMPIYEQLAVGLTVQFIPSVADFGPQANRITVGKHGEQLPEQ